MSDGCQIDNISLSSRPSLANPTTYIFRVSVRSHFFSHSECAVCWWLFYVPLAFWTLFSPDERKKQQPFGPLSKFKWLVNYCFHISSVRYIALSTTHLAQWCRSSSDTLCEANVIVLLVEAVILWFLTNRRKSSNHLHIPYLQRFWASWWMR